MGSSGPYAGHRSSCERSLYRDYVFHKQRSSQRHSLARFRPDCRW